MSTESQIRDRVLRALALNRTPGYHYVGNFLDLSFDVNTIEDVRIGMDGGAHVAEANGDINCAALAVLADMSMSANVRSGHTPATRMATVQMSLQFTGAPIQGRLQSASKQQGYIAGITSCQASTDCVVSANGKPVCYGTGTFMVLDPPKGVALYSMPHRKAGDAEIAPLAESELTRDERKVLALADKALTDTHKSGTFIRRFWGIETHALTQGAAGKLANGVHTSNRVGHLQGGLTMGLGVATAEAALPATWMLSNVTAWYIRPGEGRVIKAKSKILHHGRLTSVVRTVITGKNNKRVMEMVTTHAHRVPAQ